MSSTSPLSGRARRIGGALAFAAASAIAMPASAACPPAQPQVLLERFVSADCAACWEAAPPNPAPGQRAFALDWVVPSARGDAAPLAAAAVSGSAARAARGGSLRSDEALTLSHPLPAASALLVGVEDGPAWNGYMGLRIAVGYNAKRPLPEGLSAWLALVERIEAGSEGTPVDRQLVRTLVGPLPLDGLAERPVEHLRAVRLPETGKVERLGVVGWVETDKGRVLSVARGAFKDCPVR